MQTPAWPGFFIAMCHGLALALILAVLLALYTPALHGPFLFDDYPNLLQNPALKAWLAGQATLADVLGAAHAGPLGRPLAMLSLALQAQATGFDPWPFKLFNLLVHAVNAALVYGLVLRLMRLPAAGGPAVANHPADSGWALMLALLWAAHPLALTPVLYVVQRMSSLSALGLLLALHALLAAYQRLQADRPASLQLWLLCPLAGLLAAMCKESAALLPLFVLVFAATLLPAAALPPTRQRAWRGFVALAGVLPVLLVLLALPWAWPTLLRGFASRDFTMAQRLLTELRVFWAYLDLLVWPRPAALGLYHDDLPLSLGWWQPATTALAALALLVASMLAWWVRRRQPWLAWAWGMLVASQLLEGTLVPLELMHEHRMYLGMLPPLLALGMVLRGWVARRTAPAVARREPLLDRLVRWQVPALLLLPLLAGALVLTGSRVSGWRATFAMAELEARHHPASMHAVYDLATLYASLAERTELPATRADLFARALAAARQALVLAPMQAKPWVGVILIASESGQPLPEGAFAHLQAAFAHGARPELMVADLHALAHCQQVGDCQLSPHDLLASGAVLARHPQLQPRDRAVLEADLQRLRAGVPGA